MGIAETVGLLVKEFSTPLLGMWQSSQKESALGQAHAIQTESLSQVKDAMDGSGPKKKGEDCPTCHLSSVRNALGNRTWKLLHSLSETLPAKPDDDLQEKYVRYITAIVRNLPCTECAEDGSAYIEKHQIDVSSKAALASWLCRFHDSVNKKVGKPLHSCPR